MLHVEPATPRGPCQKFAQPHRVIVFTRYPEPGVTKTRLIPALGPELASRLQDRLTKRTLAVVQSHCECHPCDLEVRFAGADCLRMEDHFGLDKHYRPQSDGDLGTRIIHALETAFYEGTQRVLIVGADCPDLTPEILASALQALEKSDVVLGPARDGGYYLVGLRQPTPSLFQGIDWGTDQVLNQTLRKATQHRLTVHRLKTLADVDYVDDLVALRRRSDDFADLLPRSRNGVISVILPTLNEAASLEQTLTPIMHLDGVEVIVADCGSVDATVEIARRLGANVVFSSPGRGRQMNAGAALASGDVLLFLHADSSLPVDFAMHVRAALNNGAVAGAFRLTIAGKQRTLRFIEWAISIRSRCLQMPYGDQAIFVASKIFYRVDGFPNWPLMEDVELCRRLRKHGRIRLATASVITSSRRWMKLGIVKTTLVNQCCIAGYILGLSPERLARWYNRGFGGLDENV